MSTDDFLYIILLLLCIGFGHFYQKLKNPETKKLIGTSFGLFIVFLVSGVHVLHVLLAGIVCSITILFVDKRKCHTTSFVFMFSYLLFCRTCDYISIPLPPSHTNLIMMILTLKLVGLSFEVNAAHTKAEVLAKLEKDGGAGLVDASKKLLPAEEALLHLSLMEIVHYSFNYIGVLTGPYFTFHVFYDFFTLEYSKKVDCMSATIDRIKWVPLLAVLYLSASFMWPLSYATSDEFYNERSFFYRIWYVWPTFFIFRMRIYIGLTLSECVCTMAGLGAYPTASNPRCGSGPSKDLAEIDQSTTEFNFETIRNIYILETETCWTFREAMKKWNTCVQYWLAMYVYKRFPSKKFRTFATLGVSAFWHGVHPGYYFCILGAPFYVPIEDLYNKLFRNEATGLTRKIMDVICWISKFFAFSYMGTAFLLLSIDKILYYYSSVYYCGYILWAVMFGFGTLLSLLRKPKKSAPTQPTINGENNKKVE